jgi:alpha-N-arabinofuranosidase
LIAGKISVSHKEKRETPYHKPHSTEVLGLHGNPSGDDRYYNNVFVSGSGLEGYDQAMLPVWMAGNVFYDGAKPSKHEADPTVLTDVNPDPKLVERADGVFLQVTLEGNWTPRRRPLVTTELLGKAKIPNVPYEHADGSPYQIDTDFLGEMRNTENPSPGPFEFTKRDRLSLKVR